jgi:hypothetical protein
VFNQLSQRHTLAAIGRPGSERFARAECHITPAELEATLEGSFRASDSRSWTAGIVRPAPERPLGAQGATTALAVARGCLRPRRSDAN